MMNNFSGGRTKIKWRGDMLVAWFAEATPPVLWRWQASDVSAGFGLKKEEGRTELVKHEAITGSTLIAAFPNEARAQAALGQLSEAMMVGSSGSSGGYGSPGSVAHTVWKWASSILLGLVLLYFVYGMNRLLVFISDPMGATMSTMKAAGMVPPEMMPEMAPAQARAPVQAAPYTQPMPSSSLPFPFTTGSPSRSPAPAPTPQPAQAKPPADQGKPVDADSLFH